MLHTNESSDWSQKKTFTYANAVKNVYTINKDTNDKTMENLFLLGFMFIL